MPGTFPAIVTTKIPLVYNVHTQTHTHTNTHAVLDNPNHGASLSACRFSQSQLELAMQGVRFSRRVRDTKITDNLLSKVAIEVR
jgi:hypothetical protein